MFKLPPLWQGRKITRRSFETPGAKQLEPQLGLLFRKNVHMNSKKCLPVRIAPSSSVHTAHLPQVVTEQD
jgi:hypothetical protein